MKVNYYFILLSTLWFFNIKAQENSTLKGIITDETGKPLIGASININTLSKNTITDIAGSYQLQNIKFGTYTIQVAYLGYESQKISISLNQSETTQNFILKESSFQLDGIIVTAQKREQLNKDVPIAITSYGGKFIENLGISEYDAFSDYVPGLQIQIQSVNNPGIVIRGITSDSGDSRVEPRVSIFQDGVSISKSRGSVVELFDIERVEVLKGPQGTLFGRGAQIGAMHIIQNKAKNENSGELKIGTGNFNQFSVNGFVNTSLIKDKLFVRVAGILSKRDGFIENRSGGNLNGKETVAFRTSLKYLISDKTSLDVIANWQQDTPPGTSFKSRTFAPLGGTTSPNTFADLERGTELGIDRKVYGLTAILKSEINPNWDMTATTAYRAFNSDEAFDADGTAAPVLYFREIAEGKQFSQEMRFNFSDKNKLSGFFGANLFYEKGSQAVPFEVNEQSYFALLAARNTLIVNGVPTLYPNIPNDPAFGPLAGAPLLPFNKEKSTNFGKNYSGDLFADASYDLTDKLTFTVGIRATLENSNAGLEVQNADQPGILGNFLGVYPNNLFAPTNGKRTASETFTSAVGRFAINYDITDHITFFGNVARGRRPNVINITAKTVDVLSDETVWSYEFGAKSLFLNNRLQFDINAFIYDYSNFQTTIARLDDQNGLVILPNDSGTASTFGFETAVQYQFTKNSSFFANYAYIGAAFDETDSDGNQQQLAGNTFRLTPKHSFSIGFNYNPTVNTNIDLYVRPSYTYKSKVFFEETNLPNISQEGYGLFNIRTGLTLRKKYEIGLFMTNLFDKKYIVDAGNTGGTFGIPTFIAGAPQFYGVQMAVKF
jgi:iron complex outermembrane receptor protein